MDNKLVKNIRRRRSDCAWRKSSTSSLKETDVNEMVEYPAGPIHIVCSWNPVNRSDKPPYSYATIIGHAILTSKERKLTLNDIYVWITENYPFYSNDTQGWQNSIRHNLSLHKAFVKIDRDSTSQNPPRKGCFWTIRGGKEKSFIDNLQKPVNSVRKQQSLSHLNSSSFISASRRQQQQQLRRASVLSHSQDGGGFNSFRTTVIPTTSNSSTMVPEAEAIVATTTSSSSSSDHHSSSTSSSPIYHQLMVPESNTTLHVYPADEQELFGNHGDNQSYSGNSSSYITSQPPPSLSPCDAYSTTSSFPEYYNTRATQDFSFHYKPTTNLGYSNTSYQYMMDYTQPLKQDASVYYYLQQQPRLDGHGGEFSSFLHR